MIDKDSDTAPTEALEMSEDESWSLRVEATELLGRVIEKAKARGLLEQMLDDPDIAVQTAAAEVLTRQGGADGLLAVLKELGRRAQDPDADYIAYKLYWLEGMGEYPVLETASTIEPAEMTAEARAGLTDVRRLLGLPDDEKGINA
ncbi:HEAT repeat domain-containing protein [Nocardia wallacei]|uniref:HEAT repeat domain-containing protein n=1 Tax=Nocardia wallacei TaxID=480035 RepID=UPI002457A7EC|nr:HEAT repeat domain-containing protein [Nocardia wallacei]